MKSLNMAAAFLFAVGVSIATAQDIVVTPEQDTMIRDYVTKQKVESAEPPADFEVRVGATLPDTVQVRALDVPTMQVRYDYTVLSGHTVLVEPASRKIVHIIR